MQLNNINKKQQNQFYYLLAAAIILIIAWLIPYGRLVFYPLSLLGVWFHEMGHLIATILVGGKMGGIQIFSNLSGINYSYLPTDTSNAKLIFVTAIGPIMPSIFGAFLIISGRNKTFSKLALYALSGTMIITAAAFMAMYSDGMALIGILGVGIGYLATKLDDEFLRLIVHIIGIQATLSIFASFNYLTKTSAVIGGRENLSDSQHLAQLTGVNHMFWAVSLTASSLLIMMLAFLISFSYLFNTNNIYTNK